MAVRAGSTRQVMLSLRWRQFLRAGGSSSGSLARSCCSRSAVRIRPPGDVRPSAGVHLAMQKSSLFHACASKQFNHCSRQLSGAGYDAEHAR